MTRIVYEVVEHNGGWAYKLDDVFSETFDTREDATAAANEAAARHELPGESEVIEYQDENGRWHVENASGDDRPDVAVDTHPADPDPR